MTLPLNENQCVRLYNATGQHVLSVLLCSDNVYDVATPDGKVLYCGVCSDLVEVLKESFGAEPIQPEAQP